MSFKLPDLPYAKDALAPYISERTMDYHYGKHHAAYVKKTNAMAEEKGLSGRSLSEVIRSASEKNDKGLFNNSAQVWNHSFFWQCLAPAGGQKPGGKLQQMIADQFGDPQKMLDKLHEEAVTHFASGWAWLVLDRDQLKITSLHDADTPVVHEGMKPVFTIDVWEHAYYLDYQNERPKFVSEVLGNIVNWDFVEKNLDGDGISRADQAWGEGGAGEPAQRIPQGAESHP